MDIYLISGLGADERLFQYLKFPEGSNVHYLPWVNPVSKKESLQAYCKRLMWKMDTGRPHVIIGFSFGGIVAQELARLTNPKKLILMASIKKDREFPPYFRAMKSFGVHWLLPPSGLKKVAVLAKSFFGVGGKEAAKMFADMVDKTPDLFMPWAIHKMLTWKNDKPLPNIIHIHGTNDKIFPLKYIQNDYIAIEGGSHAMSMVQYEELNQVLAEQLLDIATQQAQ